MAAPLNCLVQRLRRLVGPPGGPELTDRQMLERFAAGDESAFAGLVERHGPLIFGICRRMLPQEADAEDAFQATFLVLARRAHGLRWQESVGNWLFEVALRVCRKARATAARRQRREREAASMRFTDSEPEATHDDLKDVLDAELERLPARYRAPVLLCYLGGKSNEEAAGLLGWPIGTVKSRLARARQRLRGRLARRGLVLAAGAVGSELAQTATAAVPARLASSTIQAATRVAAQQTAAVAGVSASVAALTQGVIQTMWLTKLKLIGTLVLVIAILGAGGFLIYQGAAFGVPVPDKSVAHKSGQGTDPAGVPLQARLVAREDTYPLDLGGKSAEDFRKHLAALNGTWNQDPPSEQMVDLELVLTNIGSKELTTLVGADNVSNPYVPVLRLHGPGAVNITTRVTIRASQKSQLTRVTLAPGKSYTLAIKRLRSGTAGNPHSCYWTEPGACTLTASILVAVSPPPQGGGNPRRYEGLEFSDVVLTSNPVTLKVLSEKSL